MLSEDSQVTGRAVSHNHSKPDMPISGIRLSDQLHRRLPTFGSVISGKPGRSGATLQWWLRRRYFQETGSVPSAGAIRSALGLLEARAQFDGPERAVYVRVAEHSGRIGRRSVSARG